MRKFLTQPKQTSEGGFTLIEMLVSLAIFTMVVTMSVGTLIVLISANGRAQNMQLVMTNLSFTLDSMTREIRTGTDWFCGTYTGGGEPTIPTPVSSDPAATQDCTSGNYFAIVESGNSLTEGLGTNRVTYWHDSDYYGDKGALLRKLGGPTGLDGDWVTLTGPDVSIDTFYLEVSGTERLVTNGTDTDQPMAVIYIKGRAGFSAELEEKVFELQTSITQRLLDI